MSNFKHINGDEQILDGSIGTDLIADGSITGAKLAIGSIPSSSLLVNSDVDFNNFEALQFRVENVNFFPIPGNPGRLIWRTDLRDLFVDSDYALTISATTFTPFQVGVVIDATNMSVNSTIGINVGDAIVQGGTPFDDVSITEIIDGTNLAVDDTTNISIGNVITQDAATSTVTAIIDATHLTVTNTAGFVVDTAVVSTPFALAVVTSIVDATHLTVDSTVGFVGRATVSVDFGIVFVTNATDLVVDNSTAISVGDVIVQGLASTTVTAVTDLTHIVVTSTAGFAVGIADVLVLIDILAIPDGLHLTVSKTTGFGPGDPITQGLASTVVSAVIDGTHLLVGSSVGFQLNGATDSTVVVNDTSNVNAGMYLKQGNFSSLILNVASATHLAVLDASVFILGTAFIGNWVSINEGGNVTSIFADGGPHIQGNVEFLSGTNVDLAQLSQTITVNVPAAGSTGQVQFNNDASDNFGADTNLFWNNNTKRLGIGNVAPLTTLDVTGTAHVSGATTLSSTLDVTGATTLNNTLDVVGATDLQSTLDVTAATDLHSTLDVTGAATLNSTLDVTAATTLNNTLDVTNATTLQSTLDVTGATTLNNTLDVTNTATFAAQVGVGTVAPAASASVDVVSTTQGLLTPRMTTVQRDAIVSPAVGLLIYNLTTNQEEYWNGSIWAPIGNTAVAGNNTEIQYNNNGVFGADPMLVWRAVDNTLRVGIDSEGAAISITGTSGGYLYWADENVTASTQRIAGGPSTEFLIKQEQAGQQLHLQSVSGDIQLEASGVNTKTSLVSFNAPDGDPYITFDQANGTMDIYPGENGNSYLTIRGDDAYLPFWNASGTGPYHATLHCDGDSLDVTSRTGRVVNIITDEGVSNQTWTFNVDGSLTVPGSINLSTHLIHNVVDPVAAQDAATKNYVDGPSHTVAGSNTQIQYNNSGNFGANPGFTYDAATNDFIVKGLNGPGYASIEMLSNLGGYLLWRQLDTTPLASIIVDAGAGNDMNLTLTQGKFNFVPGTSGSNFNINDTANTRTAFEVDSDNSHIGLHHRGDGYADFTITGDGTYILTSSISDGTIGRIVSSNLVSFYIGTDQNIPIIVSPNNGSQFTFNTSAEFVGPKLVAGDPTFANPVVYLDGANATIDAFNPGSGYEIYLPADTGGAYMEGDNLSLRIGPTYVSGSHIADPSAKLQLDSTTRGFLPPRMTTLQRDAIASPATGLIIYNITLGLLQEYNGAIWTTIGQATHEQEVFNIVGPGNVFNLASTPITNSQVVYYNGLALAQGVTEDYTIAANVVTLNGSIVLANGDKILIVYSHY